MAFESLTDRLAGVFKKLRGHGKLSEADIKAAMRWKPMSTTRLPRISVPRSPSVPWVRRSWRA